MARRLSNADVVLFGEQHDDSLAHQAQHALLRELSEQPRPIILGLESFERDVQPHLDAYLAERIREADLIARSRPWPNYSVAYRPLVELAKQQGWPVLASNIPRRLAAAIASGGADTLQALGAAERRWVARQMLCPRDAYYERFVAAMQEHTGSQGGHPGQLDDARVERFFQAQCAKDETMAESIAQVLREKPDVRVVHVQGGFHSDYGQGIVPRLARRVPEADLRTLSAIPVEDLDAIDPAEHHGRAGFLVFTRATKSDPEAPERD